MAAQNHVVAKVTTYNTNTRNCNKVVIDFSSELLQKAELLRKKVKSGRSTKGKGKCDEDDIIRVCSSARY